MQNSATFATVYLTKMKRCKAYIIFILVTLCSFNFAFGETNQKSKDFVVVIDAGHGGRDPGAVGRISKEKDINLKVALKLGNLIKKNCPDVKLIYTRDKDVFLTLNRRAEIANNAKADLFISIHTNALEKNKTAQGASTWTLGLAKSEANLAVAQRENSVILYEDDYKTRYAGFNPKSAESYIIFEFIQDKHMEQSVQFASLIQKQFKNRCKRIDRGVHQNVFLVLKETAMPSVLVELGFISTPAEEKYLNTDAGTTNMANGIYHAFLNYKREHEIKMTGSSKTILPKETDNVIVETKKEEKPAPQSSTTQNSKAKSGDIVFKLQILASATPIKSNDKAFKGVQNIESYKEGGMHKYTTGASTDYNKVLQTKRNLESKFKGAFIVAFKDGKKISTSEAIAEFKKKQNKK